MENSGVETDTLPQLYYPFSPVISPYADAIHENTLEWLGRFEVFDEDAAYNAFYSSHIGRLAARFHPDASQDALQLVSDWYAWMFLKDDQRDESDFGKHPELLAAANNRYLEILKGADPRVSEQPLLYAQRLTATPCREGSHRPLDAPVHSQRSRAFYVYRLGGDQPLAEIESRPEVLRQDAAHNGRVVRGHRIHRDHRTYTCAARGSRAS